MFPTRFTTALSVLLVLAQLHLPLQAQSETPDPVLLVVANQDVYYPDYILPRQALEAAGFTVTVAAPQAGIATSHGADPDFPVDVALSDVEAASFSGVVLVGGWGASALQYQFPGTYHNPAYNGDPTVQAQLNSLLNDFDDQDKMIGSICYGISLLAWARIDGVSPVAGRDVVGYFGSIPQFSLEGENYSVHTSWHVAQNGGNFLAEGSVGDPTTSADDVLVDGNLVFGESFRCGTTFGEVFAAEIHARFVPPTPEPLPVLLVLANDGFYFQEYNDTRIGLEAQGLSAVVAAGDADWCVPHPGSGQGAESGWILPDLTLAEVDVADYAAVAFIGGWGSSHYQYAFPGTYSNPYYGNNDHRDLANQIIQTFVDADKIISAICHGVAVLAWARVEGASPLNGKDVATYALGGPAGLYDGVWYSNWEVPSSWHVTVNGGNYLPSGSIGDPGTVADDVMVDFGNGIRVITAENYDTALAFGQTLAAEILAE
ncbi:DJ-1/PfpI family protein [Acanthopleuribacter pedis]|uniref:DJ-1/PfpI family protein n=1 Tax=Acanthopleuribacter pedis TaxID=442870 RepID=A0A8J7QAE0_9BACT|nr:DJ-1/PfpI family protein [Acanthopleuribacter pedis]MBO1320409.1 DJ-1/PfpI family protein [Acanthopleuribacter pedis]